MKVIDPSPISLLYTNVPANTEPEYDPATIYAKGDKVQIAALRRVFESAADTNQGNYPPDNLITKWIDLGATEQGKMVDEFVNTQTAMAEQLHVKVGVEKIDHLLLLGVTGTDLTMRLWDKAATSVSTLTVGLGSQTLIIETAVSFAVDEQVTLTDQADSTLSMTGAVTSFDAGTSTLVVEVAATTGTGTASAWNVESLLWSETVDLVYTDQNISSIEDFTMYFYGQNALLYADIFRQVGALAFTPTLEIIIDHPGNAAKLAVVTAGRAIYIGKTFYGSKAGMISWSKKVTDDYGRTSLEKGPNAKRPSLLVWVDWYRRDIVYQWLAALDGKACAWVGDDKAGTMSLMAYGFFNEFNIAYQAKNKVLLDIDVEGLS